MTIFVLATPARAADLPSLMPDRSDVAAAASRSAAADHAASPDGATVMYDDVQRLRKQLFHFNAGAMDYRISLRGIWATFHQGDAKTQFSYSKHRLAAEWSSFGGNVKFSVGSEPGDNAYLIEFSRPF